MHPHPPLEAGRFVSLSSKSYPGSNAAYSFALRHGIKPIIQGLKSAEKKPI